ncbi:unnamed protein product, partial [Closterium sp. Naga37s-1]
FSAVSGESYRGTLGGLMSIARSEGIAGLYRGLGSTLLRDAPYSGIYLVLYSRMRSLIHDRISTDDGHAARTVSTMAAGAAAGALATILTHPPDVVRTHLQLASLRATPGKPLTMLGATSAIYKSQGLPGFFRGVVPRVLKRSMQQALTRLPILPLLLPLFPLPFSPSLPSPPVAGSSWFLPRGGAACAEAINAASTHMTQVTSAPSGASLSASAATASSVPRNSKGQIRPSRKALRRLLDALVLSALCHLPGIPRTHQARLGPIYWNTESSPDEAGTSLLVSVL